MAPRVTIVVPTFNRCESLLDTLSSIKELEIPDGVNCDVIIVDNNSSDDTPAVVQGAGRDSPINIQYLREIRKGSSYARNAGVHVAGGELIFFADDDVHVEKTWLGALLKAFQQHDAACIGGKVLPNWLGPRPPWLEDHFLNVLAMLDYGDRPQELGRNGDNRMLYAANLAFRRSVFLEIGGFDTAIGRCGAYGGGEDREIQERLIQRGHKVLYEPAAIVLHRIEPYRMRKRYFRHWHFAAGKDRARVVRLARFHVFGIESYLIVEFVRTLASLIKSAFSMKFNEVFEHELKCILYLSIFGHKIRRAISG
jgi:GT2 family glycosyltransferase